MNGSKGHLPKVMTSIFGNGGTVRRIAVTIMPQPWQWWAGMDCACAIENMFLAATSLGIASCWINQLGTTCDDPEVRAYLTSLGVPENHKVYGCVALGYKAEGALLKEKTVKAGTITIVE